MPLSPGARLGRYEIVGPLGAGGMGEVYRARDPRLGRDVAVKVLRGNWAEDAEHVTRFEREARATASLSHPHVVAIFDIGSHDGCPFLVTELLEGETLADRIGRGALPQRKAVEIGIQIAQGLAAAHERGIIHRDLKPQNVLICAGDRAKILDFGLAKLRGPLEDEAKTTAWQTQAGTILGTFGYMAPEDVRGGAGDHRGDLFSLGAVLYEMLTGTRAFRGQSALEVVAAILEQAVPSPSIANPEVTADLGALVRRCLEKDPRSRFQSAREVVDALLAVGIDGEAPRAPARRLSTTASIAVLPFIDMSPARDQDYFCEGLAEEITDNLSQARGLRVIARTSAFRFRDQARDIREIGRALGASAILEGSIRAAGSRVRIAVQLVDTSGGHQIWSDRFDRDLGDVLALQDDISRRVAESLSARLASGDLAAGRTHDSEAHTLYLRGRHYWKKRTEAGLEESLDYFRRALARDPDYAQAYAGLADALVTLGIYGVRSPAEIVEPARVAASRALALAPTLAGPLACLACIEGLHDRAWERAVDHFHRAIDLSGDDANLRQWYATNALVPLGRFDEALRELRLAQALDPLSLPISASIGITLYYGRRFDEAAEALADTCRLEDGFGLAHLFLGYVHSAGGRFEAAAREIGAAVQMAGRTPENLSALGYALSSAGDERGARALIDELQTLASRRYVSPVQRAQVLVGLGDRAGALDELERSERVRAMDLVWVRSKQVFDSLRAEPRFQALPIIQST